jgi:hypothetical protein
MTFLRPSSFHLLALAFVLLPVGVTCNAGSGVSKSSGASSASGSGQGGSSTGGGSPGVGGEAAASGGSSGSSLSSSSSSGDAGSGQDGAASVGCSGLPLCDGFESDTAGMAPDPTLWTVLMGCNPNMANSPAPDGGLLVGVDSSQAHTGKNSLRVVGGDSCGYYAINTSAFATLGSQVYARFWALFSGAPTMNHNGFVSMYSGTATNFLQMYSNSEQLRLGFQGDVIVWNYSSSDATLPDIDPQGEMQSVATEVGQWSCIEFHLDQTTGDIEFWFQAQESSTEASVPGLGYDGTSTSGVSDDWHGGGPTSLLLKSFGLGWLGLNNQYTAWFDDVALANARIGCQ